MFLTSYFQAVSRFRTVFVERLTLLKGIYIEYIFPLQHNFAYGALKIIVSVIVELIVLLLFKLPVFILTKLCNFDRFESCICCHSRTVNPLVQSIFLSNQ